MTGLIWLAIVAGWLAYLVPRFTTRRGAGAASGGVARMRVADSMRVIRPCRAEYSQQSDPELQVSTPLQREAVIFDVRRASQIAARRRRVGLMGSFLLALAGVAVAVLTPAPWWFSLVGVGLLVVFVVLSRISVYTVETMLDEKLATVYESWDEETVSVGGADLTDGRTESAEISIELDLPVNSSIGSLWEPLAVTPQTYISKPLMPRSVRTIDLTTPMPPASQPQMPVTAERPSAGEIVQETRGGDLPRAVGE